MKSLFRKSVFVAWATLAFAGASQALALATPVASNAYITVGALQWAWASPLEQSTVDLSTQAIFGWRLPTAAELSVAPLATAFVFRGANVPNGGTDAGSGATFTFDSPGGDAACASPWFNATYFHCDWGNGPGSGGANVLPWNVGDVFSDSLVVRAVPEPSTYLLMALGLSGLGVAARRRS